MARIMVVEDDPATNKFMRYTLERDGHTIDAVHDGGEAAAMLARGVAQYGVVVTDHGLPTMSGLDLVALVRRLDPHMPCIMATGSAELDIAVQAMEAGAVNYLVKPFRGDTLRVVVARALE